MNETELLQAFYEDIKEPECPYPEDTIGSKLWILEEPHRSKAIQNTIEAHGSEHLQQPTKDPTKDILDYYDKSFSWGRSSEGLDYWMRVWKTL